MKFQANIGKTLKIQNSQSIGKMYSQHILIMCVLKTKFVYLKFYLVLRTPIE